MLKVIQMSYTEQVEAEFSVTAYICVPRRAPGRGRLWREARQEKASEKLPTTSEERQRAEVGARQVASQPKSTNRTYTVL